VPDVVTPEVQFGLHYGIDLALKLRREVSTQHVAVVLVTGRHASTALARASTRVAKNR
jgi:hypothetical protein